MVLDCTAQQVYDLLADYDRVGDIFTNILQSATTVGPDCDTTLDQVTDSGQPRHQLNNFVSALRTPGRL
jgi:hypothetical protein